MNQTNPGYGFFRAVLLCLAADLLIALVIGALILL